MTTDNHARRPIIDKATLLPVGVALLLAGLAFTAGSEWRGLRSQVAANEREISRVEERVDNNSRDIKLGALSMELWRRDLAARGIQLPEPAGLPDPKKPDPTPPPGGTPQKVADLLHGVRTHG